jgi:hypothetical protein
MFPTPMLYFGPRHDENTLMAIEASGQKLEVAYREYLQFSFQKHLFYIPLDSVPKEIRDEHVRLLKDYQSIRASLIGNQPMMKEFAERYALKEPTAILLMATDLSGVTAPELARFTYKEQQAWFDALNMLLGAVRFKRTKELRQLINPGYWIWLPIRWILRLPLNTLKVMGFDVVEFEKQFWGKVLLLAFIVALLWVALKWFNISVEQITNLVKAIKQ